MTEDTNDIHENDHEIGFDENALSFKTSSVIENSLLLSLIYIGLILFLPFILWNHVDHKLIFLWQGSMIGISVAHWISKTIFGSKTEKKLTNHFWSRTLLFLILLDGIGWGVFGAFLFPIESTLAMSLVALFLIGIGSIGAVSYSARMLIAAPYIMLVVLPYTIRLYVTGGYEEFLIATVLGFITIMFCFVADRLNISLNNALEIDKKDEDLILSLEDENFRLQKIIESKTTQSKNLEDQFAINVGEIENIHSIVSQYLQEQHYLAGNAINLLSDIRTLDLKDLDQEQRSLIKKIEEKARHLSDNLNNESDDKAETKLKLSNYNQVLIVNDDKSECKKIESILNDQDLSYEIVQNAPAALAKLCEAEANNDCFDIVIADMWMPDMGGVSFAECLLDDPEFQDIKLIMLSSEEKINHERLKKLGIHQILKKPLQSDDLVHAFEKTLEIQPISEKGVSNLPPVIEALVDDAIQISIPSSEPIEQKRVSSPIIDRDVISSLRSTTNVNFIQIVNEYLEEAPKLIQQAEVAYLEKNYSVIKELIKELGSRSLHIGATGLVKSARNIDETIEHDGVERIMGMIQSINADFIQVESALLADLTSGALLSDHLKH